MSTAAQQQLQPVDVPTDATPPAPEPVQPRTEDLDWVFVVPGNGKNVRRGERPTALWAESIEEVPALVTAHFAREDKGRIFPFLFLRPTLGPAFVEQVKNAVGVNEANKNVELHAFGDWHVSFPVYTLEPPYNLPVFQQVPAKDDLETWIRGDDTKAYYQYLIEQGLEPNVLPVSVKALLDFVYAKCDTFQRSQLPGVAEVTAWLAEQDVQVPAAPSSGVSGPSTKEPATSKPTRLAKTTLDQAVKSTYEHFRQKGITPNSRDILQALRSAGAKGQDGKLLTAYRSYEKEPADD